MTESAPNDYYRREREHFHDPLPSDVPYTRAAVSYGTGGGRALKAWLYQARPLPRTAVPAVVYIHGGGWSGGTPAQFARHAAYGAARGIAGLVIEYRLSGEALFPAAVEDCKCAVRYLRAGAARLQIDPERIAVVGGSAGAHLAAFLLTTSEQATWDGSGGHEDESSAVCAGVLFNGVFRFPRAELRQSVRAFLGKSHEDAPELYRQASPLNHVNHRTGASLLIHGEEDVTVPIEQSIAFHEQMLEFRCHSELIRIAGVGHGWFNRGPYFDSHLGHAFDFLQRRLLVESDANNDLV